jgi:hypothetical protein
MTNAVLTFGNNKAVLVNGKAVLYKVEFENFTNRMDIARLIIAKYENAFKTVAEVIAMLRAYEKTNDFVICEHCAYILHKA